jgi:hypothetical protein
MRRLDTDILHVRGDSNGIDPGRETRELKAYRSGEFI